MAKKKRSLVRAPEYTVEVLGRRYPVINMVQASNFILENFSNQYGASQIGSQFKIRENGEKVVGYVSYNGKVWAGAPEGWPDRVHLVYDPYNKAHVDAYASQIKEAQGRRIKGNPGHDWSKDWVVVDEDGVIVAIYDSKGEAQKRVNSHNKDRSPYTLEWFLQKGIESRGRR